MSDRYKCPICPGHAPELCPCPKTLGTSTQNTFHACALCSAFPCACHLPRPALPPEFYEAMGCSMPDTSTIEPSDAELDEALRRDGWMTPGELAARLAALEEAAAVAVRWGEGYGTAWKPASIMIAQEIRALKGGSTPTRRTPTAATTDDGAAP